MERIEEFKVGDRDFLYIDLSHFLKNEEFAEFAEMVKPIIAEHEEHSLYTITNIEDVRFDSKSKGLIVSFLVHNKPYVKYAAVIGLDGIKKMMVSTAAKLSGRGNIHFAFTKEQAIEWLLKQD